MGQSFSWRGKDYPLSLWVGVIQAVVDWREVSFTWPDFKGSEFLEHLYTDYIGDEYSQDEVGLLLDELRKAATHQGISFPRPR